MPQSSKPKKSAIGLLNFISSLGYKKETSYNRPNLITSIEQKSIPIGGIFDSFHSIGSGIGFYLSYFRNIKDAYALASRVAPVADAIARTVTEFSQIDKILFKKSDKDGVLITDWEHPFVKLLKFPNSFQTGMGFNEELAYNRRVGGNVYLYATGIDKDKPPLELYCIHPQSVHIQNISFDGKAESYIHTPLNGSTMTFKRVQKGKRVRYFSDTGELYHFKNLSLNYELSYGLNGDSHLTPLIIEILQYEAASIHNRSMLINGMRPSGILVYKGTGDLLPEQMEMAKKELNQASGIGNAGKRMILNQDFHWIPLSESMKDGDFRQIKRDTANNIYSMLGVPLAISTETKVTTYNNLESSRSMLYHNNVLPFTKKICEELFTFIFLDRYQDAAKYIKLGYDETTIPALQTEILDRAIKAKESEAFTLNERRRSFLGLGRLSGIGDSVILAPGATLVGEDGNINDSFGREDLAD